MNEPKITLKKVTRCAMLVALVCTPFAAVDAVRATLSWRLSLGVMTGMVYALTWALLAAMFFVKEEGESGGE